MANHTSMRTLLALHFLVILQRTKHYWATRYDLWLNSHWNWNPKEWHENCGLETQDSQLNSKENSIPKKIIPPKYKFKRMKKYGNIRKFNALGFTKWSSNLLREMRGSIGQNNYGMTTMQAITAIPFTLHKLCHMATSNINGLHTTIHPQNMWLLKRPRVKIK